MELQHQIRKLLDKNLQWEIGFNLPFKHYDSTELSIQCRNEIENNVRSFLKDKGVNFECRKTYWDFNIDINDTINYNLTERSFVMSDNIKLSLVNDNYILVTDKDGNDKKETIDIIDFKTKVIMTVEGNKYKIDEVMFEE